MRHVSLIIDLLARAERQGLPVSAAPMTARSRSKVA